MSEQFKVEIREFTPRFIKKVMKKILKDRIEQLVKLSFDLSYSTKIFNLFGGDEKLATIPKDVDDLKQKSGKEKLKGNNKDKTQIIRWEKEEIELSELKEDLKDLRNDKDKSRTNLIKGIRMVEELEAVQKNPKMIYDNII